MQMRLHALVVWVASMGSVCVFSISPHAESLSGRWYGIIEGYSYSEPRRVMKIAEDRGRVVCTWDELNKSTDYPASCTVKDSHVELTTGGASKVALLQVGDHLEGTFTLKNGEAFPIRMTRNQDILATKPADKLDALFPGTAPNAAGLGTSPAGKVCRGIISLVSRGYTGYGRTALWMELKSNSVTVWYRVGLSADDGTTVPVSKDGMTLLRRAIPVNVDGDRLSFNPFTRSQYTLRPKGPDYQVDMKNDGGVWAGNLTCQ